MHFWPASTMFLCKFEKVFTSWKVSVFGVFLVRILPHSDWIRRGTPYLPTFSPNAEKYRPEKLWIQTLLTQCSFLSIKHHFLGQKILYFLKINIKDTRSMCWICSKLTKRQQHNVWNFFKVNNKNTRATWETCSKLATNILGYCL